MDAAKADLMRALGRLVRGLSTLFWIIPLTLAADVETARTNWLDALGALSFGPALVFSGLLWYGLYQMRDFQRQERIWQVALHRAGIFATINIGLARRMPGRGEGGVQCVESVEFVRQLEV